MKLTKKQEASKKWRDKNKEKIRKYNEKYYQKNKEKIIERNIINFRKKFKEDKNFKSLNNIRRRLRAAIKGLNKSQKTLDLLGCDISFLWKYLEKKFKPGMSKENYGEWHIDHIVPCASFDLSDPKQQEKCFHYTNLQPLWARENLQKSSKIL